MLYWERLNKLFNEFNNITKNKILWGVFEQSIVSGSNFLLIALGAHFLPVEEQGKLGYVIAIYMAMIVLNMGLVFQWAQIKAPKEKSLEKYFSYLLIYQFIVSVVFVTCSGTILYYWGGNIGWNIDSSEVVLLCIFLFFQSLVDFVRRTAYIHKNAYYAFLSSISVYPFRLILLILLTPETLQSVLILITISTIFPVFLFINRGIKYKAKKITIKQLSNFIRSHIKNSKWFVFSAPLSWLWAFFPVFYLGKVGGLFYVGILISIRSLANVSNIFIEMLETQFATELSKLSAVNKLDKLKSVYRKVLFSGGLIWLIILCLFVIFSNELIFFFLGESYTAYSKLLILVWFIQGSVFLYKVKNVLIRNLGDNRVLLLSYALGCLISILSSYMLIESLNVAGAAFSLLISAVTIYIVLTLYWLYIRFE